MVICPQCNIKHGKGEEFCRKCGKFLLTIEDISLGEEKPEVKLFCPRCRYLYKKGIYCRQCGSLLMETNPSQNVDAQPLEKKSVKKKLKEWLRLLKEEKELQSCMSKLQEQRDSVSSDVLNPIFIRYMDQLESLSPLRQEMETELESMRRRALDQIDFLEKELNPIQKRLGEFQSLYKLGAVTKPDFVREKMDLRREMKSRDKSLKNCRQILSLLPNKREENFVFSEIKRNPLRPFPGLIAVVILLILAGGTFLWQYYSPSSRGLGKEMAPSPSASTLPILPPALTEDQEVEKIKSLFETIKQANLKKNIDLFMSCYSRDFNDREGKRRDALETWGFFNYLDLSYDLKDQKISGDSAAVRLEWLIRISKKAGGQRKDKRTLLDVTLKREEGYWKIKEIKTVS